MFFSIILTLICISLSITADPGPIGTNGAPPPSYNYYQYQQQTPSPYTGKRNPSQNYPSDQSSLAATYGNPPTRSSSNQCKLHINCPSKKTISMNTSPDNHRLFRCTKSCYIGYSRTTGYIRIKFFGKEFFFFPRFRTTWSTR